jgi:hypothetical protein
MNEYSYDSEKVKGIFKKDPELYELEDWRFLAEFHEHHHREWIDISLSLLKDAQTSKLAFNKLHNHFIKRFGMLPSRVKAKGLLSLTRGRPKKVIEHQRIRELIFRLKDLGMTDAKAMEYLISNNLIDEMDSRNFSRIKNGG